ncbi:hypothetical protein [Streptomyces sp. E2N166]|uniref:DUF4760 domain-containing protein n=1 Tax=Streptomyces sp. E2N166 TaxID=1851909 RepID=UPI0012929C5D|nr:hypothetical protein [Streptomyces sp. E2N166]
MIGPHSTLRRTISPNSTDGCRHGRYRDGSTPGDFMDIAALVVSITALTATLLTSLRQLVLARHANTLPAVVGLFQEHRGAELARARHIVVTELAGRDLSEGLAAVPEEHRQQVLNLCWFYDNIGALVAHGVVPLAPVSGYLGGSVVETWKIVRPMALAEREKRRRLQFRDPERWQAYYENLYHLVATTPPHEARTKAPRWHRAGS